MLTETLKTMVASRRLFSLRLTDGSLVPVLHPEFIWITRNGKIAIVNAEGSQARILDVELVMAPATIELAGKSA